MIRDAVVDDYPVLHRMGASFQKASGYTDICGYCEETTTKTFDLLREAGCLLTDGKSGMIGFMVYPLFMDSSVKVAQEAFWWVDEDSRGSGLGIRLMEAAESRAKELGAKSMMMLCLDELNGDGVESLYRKKGYKPRERTFMRYL